MLDVYTNAMKPFSYSFVILFVVNIIKVCICQEERIVITPLGKIEGHWIKTINNRRYLAFEGIPYAVPPIGKYRFEEPVPIGPWIGIWKANSQHKCLQYNHYTEPNEDFVVGNEDCLYLNIYTPDVNLSKSYDVVIFIHGGAFMFNSASVYGSKYIMDRDIVYVSFNYRLGPLGFLSTEDKILPGNNGLKDQILALKWIKQYVQLFGGNPHSITLTGMSAGGSSVQIHYLSPLSQGLFHRGIAQSGTALNNWVLVENSLEKSKKLGRILGCNFDDSRSLVKCLKGRSGRQIVDSVKYFLAWLYNPFSPFGVVIDKWSDNPVLPEHPYALLKKGRMQNLPLIFSCVQSEGLYPAADFLREPEYLKTIDEQWNKLIPYILDYKDTIESNEMDIVSGKIRQKYFGDKRVNKETFSILVKMITDRLFIADIELAAKLHASASTSQTYFYYFTYRGAHSKSETRSRTNENFGASHGDDTVYVLSSNVDTRTTDSDTEMSNVLLDIWTQYAKNGAVDENWRAMNKNSTLPIVFLHIKTPTDIKLDQIESLGNRSFWHSLGFKENQNVT